MSILRPKDGDYIVRGIFLLVGWICVGGFFLSALGGLLAGGGGSVLGVCIAVGLTPVIYWRYLKLDPAVYPQRPKDPNDWSV